MFSKNFFKANEMIVIAQRSLRTVAPQLPTHTPVCVISPMTARQYSTLQFKPDALGRMTLPPKSTLGQYGLFRTLITRAHEDDRLAQLVIGGKKVATAVVLNGCTMLPKGTIESNSILIGADQKPEIISTTNSKLHHTLREQRQLTVAKTSADGLKAGEHAIGGVTIDCFGPYFGGNPTSYCPRSMGEQIYPDAMLFSTPGGVDEFRGYREEVECHGPRISSHKKTLLLRDDEQQLRQETISDRAFVNSTIHRTTQKGPDGEYHPTKFYTPGSSLVSFSKYNTAERHDGTIIQVIATATNASADVLCHWLSKAISLARGPKKEMSGITKQYTEEGAVESLIVHQGFGSRLAQFALLATGTPFDMTTLTIHRDKEGNPLHIMIHKKSKPWPANEALIELTGPNGERQCIIYDSIIPQAGFWRDLTVGKLATPIMTESVVAFAIKDGKLIEITDQELLADMESQSRKGQFTVDELTKSGASTGMIMAAAGLCHTDHRSRVTAISMNGEFNLDKLAGQHTEQDPGSMEFYCCGRAMRVLAENLGHAMEKNPVLQTENESVRQLWEAVTSKILTYPELVEVEKKFATVIQEILKEPAEIERFKACLDGAQKAHTADQEQQEQDARLSEESILRY